MSGMYPIDHADLQTLLDAMNRADASKDEAMVHAAYDGLVAKLGSTHAGKILSEACHQYDRIHMTPEEYEEQYTA